MSSDVAESKPLPHNNYNNPELSTKSNAVIFACRKSRLAQVQTHSCISILREKLGSSSPDFEVATGGAIADTDKQSPFAVLSKQIGGSDVGKSLWTNELEADLSAGKFHALVHCLKDMPTTLPGQFSLGAITEREDPSDAVCMPSNSPYTSIDQLPAGSVVGTSSSRRKALVKRNWPHLEVMECRGNLDTRLAKLNDPDSPYACIILATAGLVRINLGHCITQKLDPSIFPYAVGQAALGVEVLTERSDMLELVCRLNHLPSRWRGLAERSMLRSLQGGCSSPIGVWTTLEITPASVNRGSSRSGTLTLSATVLHVDGISEVATQASATVRSDRDAENVGIVVAEMLLRDGARDLILTQH